jgi:nitrogen fixation protein FixH
LNTLTTLFGGLAAVLVLYAAGGWIRGLSPVLRALLAAGIPLLAYFAGIVGRWPGLDVRAIHISVFIAAGLMLYMTSQYRQRSPGRMHWAPKLLIAFFAGLAVINATLLYIATQGLPQPLAQRWLGGAGTGRIYSGFSGVVEHGQEAAKAVSSALNQRHSESQLGWQVSVRGLLEAGGMRRSVQVQVIDRTGLPVTGLAAELWLSRPGAAEAEQKQALAATAAGEHAGLLTLPASGRWLVELRLNQGGRTRYRETLELVQP